MSEHVRRLRDIIKQGEQHCTITSYLLADLTEIADMLEQDERLKQPLGTLGMCTHCGKNPATEVAQLGTARLCTECTELRKNEDWSQPSGLSQDGENTERFQGLPIEDCQ
jgi:RNA polymerase-binding transcription factor DksA